MPPSSKRRNNNNSGDEQSSLAAEMKRKETCSKNSNLSATVLDDQAEDHHHHRYPPTRPNNDSRDTNGTTTTTTVTTIVDTAMAADGTTAGCLHCHTVSKETQVRCDECQSYICPTCHWCHEYQANHEIRVCDRCDAFYCRHCDEMDQCDDCGEVVCASCSTLLSCKFCGGGLCEECATACGRCGIVLCSRDAKFAVDCDTCRLSYCLVCLASGSKDPCVRCGHRPSKRMEQLVHLRLKSIYKAFKQSSRSPKNMNSSSEQYNQDHPNNDHHHHHHHYSKKKSESGPTIEELEEGMEELHPDAAAKTRRKSSDPDSHSLLAGAAAAMSMSSLQNQQHDITPDFLAEKFLEEKQKEADAAAQALLAELEEEEEAAKTKKSKKKRKKERQQKAKKDDDDEEEEDSKPKAAPSKQAEKQREQEQQPLEASSTTAKPSATVPKDDASSRGDSSTQKAGNETSKSTPVKNLPSPQAISPSDAKSPSTPEIDPFEKRLLDCIDESDIDGIEGILFELKGVPGRAALRKNAKKALKRLKTPDTAATEEEEQAMMREQQASSIPVASSGPVELLKLISDHKVPGKQPNRAECVMQMSPIVVGWVIGKGGQRIRDLMEESGAKVWIDQEKARPEDPRNVYISGERKAVDQAVHMVREIVSKAPIEGAAKYAPEDDPADNPQEAVARIPGAPVVAGAPVADTPTRAAKPLMQQQQQLSIPEPAPGLAPLQAVQSLDPNNQEETFEHVMTCEARFVPLLIGKRGWAIKDIQDKSGARVDIDQTVTPRQIRISGSKTSVEKAIPMVRDVLSYPHAQPQPGGDELPDGMDQLFGVAAALQQHEALPGETYVDNRPHTPPPYSYIMTGDAKSAISASSSLSSTPEPSMASSTKALPIQLATGPLIPPTDYNFSPGAQMHTPSAPNRGQYLPQDMQRGLNRMGDRGAFAPRPQQVPPPAMYGTRSGLMGIQHIQGMGMPPPHPNHDQMYNPGPKPAPAPMGHGMMHNPPPPAGYSGSAMGAPGSTKAIHDGFGMMGPTFRSTSVGPVGMPQHQMIHPSPQQPQMNRYNSLPPGSSLGGGLLPGQDGPSVAFDSRGPNPLGGWDRGLATIDYAPAPGLPTRSRLPQDTLHGASGHLGLGPDSGAFGASFHPTIPQDGGMARGVNSSSEPLGGGFDLGQSLGVGVPPGAPFSSGLDPTGGVPGPMESLRDDSRIIDNLFGPSTNTSSVGGNTGSNNDPAQSLLTGLQGLSLGGTAGLGTAGGAALPSIAVGGTGLWGDPLPDWNPATGAASTVLDSATNKDSALDTSILAGLQPFHLDEDVQQHPPQSRFNWGSTNA